jgi:uncharacterized protein YdeI (YjbR/CyaY-like superfamily)
MKTRVCRSRADWRGWLETHHGREVEVWLVFHKKHTGVSGVDYGASVEEALCFGWIDSLVKRLDADRYARKFTPRRPGSRWSKSNRGRAEKMIAAGRMTPAGLAVVEKARAAGEWDREDAPAVPGPVPPELVRRLSETAGTQEQFDRLPASLRQQYIAWVGAAKKEATRLRRAGELADTLARGERLGLK